MKREMGIWTRIAIAAVAWTAQPALAQSPEFHYIHGGQYEGVVFFDSQNGWVAGDGGRIRYTTNGGATWTTATLEEEPGVSVRSQLRGMHFLSADEGFAVGSSGEILRSKTSPPGSTEWEDANSSNRITSQAGAGEDPCVPVGQPADLYHIFMTSSLDGWAVGTNGTIVQTDDGWETWTQVEGLGGEYSCQGNPRDFYDVHFFADSDSGEDEDPYSKGIILGEYGHCLTTEDSGATWTDVAILEVGCPDLTHDNVELWEITFDDPLDWESPAWVASGASTGQGYIMYWSGGANGTWTQVRCYQFLSPSGINDTLCGLSTQYGCTMLDSGASPPRLVMVGYGGELYVYEVGDTNYDPCNCSYFTESGPTFDPDCDENEPSFVQKDNLVDAENPLLLRPPLLAAARVSSTEAVVVGDFGRVTRFDDEGSPDQISEAGTPYTCRLFDGEFLDESVGCVAGQGQLIYKTTDAGINWAVVSYDWTEANSNSIRGIDFSTDGAFGVAVGSGGFIARTTEDSQDPAPEDVVAAWTDDVTKPQHFGPELTAVAFVPSSARVFAVSSGGNVYRSNDNGASWALAAAASVYALHGVDFADNSTGYVVGDNATVLKTTNGGTSWSAVMVGDANGEAFRDIETWGDGTPAILVADNGGVYVKTSTAFEKLDENDFGFDAPPNHFFDVEVLDSGDTIRIGGDGGIALFFDDGAGWSQPRTSVGISLSKMAFQSADHGFAVGLSFLIAEYTD